MKNKLNETVSQKVCAICGNKIQYADEGMDVVIPLEEDATQNLYFHKDCFKKVLHPSVPVGF